MPPLILTVELIHKQTAARAYLTSADCTVGDGDG